MAFVEHLLCEIELAPQHDLDHLSRRIWQALSNGTIGDDDAQALAELLEERRREAAARRAPAKPRAPRGFLPPRRAIRSPDRAASRQRRRAVGQERWLPPNIASKLTQGEIAALSVIVREIVKHGVCDLCIDAIAGQAGVCPTMVKNTERFANALGWITIIHRPRRGQKSLTNLVYALSAELRAWIATRRGMIGGKMVSPTQTGFRKMLGEQEKRANSRDVRARGKAESGLSRGAG